MKRWIFNFCLFASFALIAGALGAEQFDWYRWRGPDLNGISRETGWSVTWPKEGPKRLWKASVGTGFSSVSVSQGRVYTLGNNNNQDTVYCFDATTGAPVWKESYAAALDDHYYDGGTSMTPTIEGGMVYTLSRRGDLFCFEAGTGKIVWSKHLRADLGVKIPEWGFAGSPLVEGSLLILNVGSAGSAVDKTTGKVVWTSGKGPAGYSSAVPFSVGDQRFATMFFADSVAAVNVKDGKELWRRLWKTDYNVNAADPIIMGDKLFISSGYDRGCALLKFSGNATSALWENKNMRNHFNTCVLIDGHVYGIDGDAGGRDANLRCITLATGAVKWSERSIGSGALMAAAGKLIVLSATGELVIAEATPAGFKPIARTQVLGGKCWTTPVLSNGRVYCRNSAGNLVCLDVRGAQQARSAAE